MTRNVAFAGPFALGTFSLAEAAPFPGLVVGDRALDLSTLRSPAGARTTRELLENWDEALTELRRLADAPRREDWLPLEELRVHPPVEPHQILQAGANYRKHVIELTLAHRLADDDRPEEVARAEAEAGVDRRAAEGEPYVFTGLHSSLAGAYDDLRLPGWSEQVDWELELCAVITKPAYRVRREEALAHVGAYTIANDITARDAVFRDDLGRIGADWRPGKNLPGFTPLGPFLVPAEHIGAPEGLRLTLKLNGEVKQDDWAKDMIFDVAALVSYASQTTQLLPGDLLLTGSPAGNGIHWGRLLRDGDVMESTITGLGTQITRCAAERH
ncbi:hydrolase [Streptomyces sp. SID8382]|uniref:fumarylacetoacetate hydrolase family protein n=1 Tax=Streptomyces malaysiensis TaxID=92644 RepID=UPI000C2C139C|nr:MULTISPECIES: fumarylacetoacetate hydrolase family protein [unclassified Streptomyces]AUA08369.1 Ureidoglycolate lyase [Streptomyces sp. M56]MYX56655.1 hydrolase [Streptomyces sp. SID8382]